MLIYRRQEREANPYSLLHDLHESLWQCEFEHFFGLDAIVSLLIDYAELETAIADAFQTPAGDSCRPECEILREGGIATGHIFYLSVKSRSAECAPWGKRLRVLLQSLQRRKLPESVLLRTQEGFSDYGLFPQTYLSIAEKYVHEHHPESVICIGLRSIGTTLSSVVAATLEEHGCHVNSWTLRPAGHPFDRHIVLSPQLKEKLSAWVDRPFLVVDEGPGLSGSSFLGTVRMLEDLHVASDRIHIFCNWNPGPSQLRTEAAAQVWQSQHKYVAEFHPNLSVFDFRQESLQDYSGGMWRRDLGCAIPAHPQHEKRKFRSGNLLFKFAGLGHYGKAKQVRAAALSQAGFSTAPIALRNGFLVTTFVPGVPVPVSRSRLRSFLETVTDYLVFRRRSFSASDEGVSFDELADMTEVNLQEALPQFSIPQVARYRTIYEQCGLIDIDGRMMQWEWLQTPEGFLKTDCLDHCCDHFFPGRTNAAWDLAGTIVELSLNQEQQQYVLQWYVKKSRDVEAILLLPFLTIAYTAYRIGYCQMATEVLKGTPDAPRFAHLKRRYMETLATYAHLR